MKTLLLVGGKNTTVDDDVYEWAKAYRWRLNNYGYVTCKKSDQALLLHRLIANTPKGMSTDHINHDKLDNRRSNLRVCSKRQNAYNRRRMPNNTSGYRGVQQLNGANRWLAAIGYNYKSIKLGVFDDKDAAARAYNEAAVKYFGEFATLNVIPSSK